MKNSSCTDSTKSRPLTDEQERSIWDSAITAALKECHRLNSAGKDDHRDSWMGNAIRAINNLYAPDLTKDSEF